MRPYIGLAIGALIGGAIGYSKLICPDGSCMLTGSWFGGAFVGAMLGLVFLGGGSTSCCRKTDANP